MHKTSFSFRLMSRFHRKRWLQFRLWFLQFKKHVTIWEKGTPYVNVSGKGGWHTFDEPFLKSITFIYKIKCTSRHRGCFFIFTREVCWPFFSLRPAIWSGLLLRKRSDGDVNARGRVQGQSKLYGLMEVRQVCELHQKVAQAHPLLLFVKQRHAVDAVAERRCPHDIPQANPPERGNCGRATFWFIWFLFIQIWDTYPAFQCAHISTPEVRALFWITVHSNEWVSTESPNLSFAVSQKL